MRSGLLLLFVVQQSAVQVAHGARILGLFPDISRSHSMQNRPLFRALAARGHHVTMLSGFPESEPVTNYKDIVIEGIAETASKRLDFTSMASNNAVEAMINLLRFGDDFLGVMEQSFSSNGTQTLLRSTEKFDLIFVDVTLSLFYLGFIPKFGNPPFIAIVPFGSNNMADMFAGNPDNPSFMPIIYYPFSGRMNFFERFMNTIEYIGLSVFTFLVLLPNVDRNMRTHFGESAPGAWQIAQNMSLLMVNTDIAHDYPRPLTPQTIEIGGLHLQPGKPLPQDLQKFLDESPAGAILFSMGSVLRSDKLDSSTLAAILGALAALPQRVLWKWESDTLPGLPANVMVRKWLPQNDVLAHRNVKLFITHGGISSLEEAVYHGVPMVVIPVFNDQFFQAKKIVTRGIGVKVDYKKLSKESLLGAINEVLTDKRYASNIAHIRRLARDKMRTPLQTAIFWTEYVLRHGGAQHLRTSGTHMPWYRYFLLDVVPAILLAFVLPLVALLFLARRVATTSRFFGEHRRNVAEERAKRTLSARQPTFMLSKEL